jgi:hypothetical protein
MEKDGVATRGTLMLPPHHIGITLGPLFRTIADDAGWPDDPVEQFFPRSQIVADEYERYLGRQVW